MLRALQGKRTAYLPKLVGMILAALTPDKYTFEYLDESVESIDFGSDADMVVITAMTAQACRAYQIAGEFRKRGKVVVIGGIHAAVMREEVLAHCDVLMIGESENSWPVMLEDYENNRLKQVYDAKEYPPVENLISPRIDIIDPARYLCFPIQATRGCPYNCEFCSIEYSSGERYRMKPVSQVINEILAYQEYDKKRGFAGIYEKGFYFVDDNLYVNREYVKELLTALIPLKIRWDGQGTANMAKDDEVLQLLAESGCRTFSIGLESIVPESLQEMNKPKVNKIEEYKAMLSNIAKYGIVPGAYFVFGFDSDDIFVFRRTLAFIQESDVVEPIVSLLTPYPGTKLYERIKNRIYTTYNRSYNSGTCVYTPQNMTAGELQAGMDWMGWKTSEFPFMKKQLEKFWNYGPWKNTPFLTTRERLLLICIALKLGFAGLWEYQRFAFWVAFHRKAKDLKSIIWIMRRRELSMGQSGVLDPADSKI
jgi:radical SAM superfamily enzyme YgiQ (UPF0313 family)